MHCFLLSVPPLSRSPVPVWLGISRVHWAVTSSMFLVQLNTVVTQCVAPGAAVCADNRTQIRTCTLILRATEL